MFEGGLILRLSQVHAHCLRLDVASDAGFGRAKASRWRIVHHLEYDCQPKA
jgi:hypothetical protein